MLKFTVPGTTHYCSLHYFLILYFYKFVSFFPFCHRIHVFIPLSIFFLLFALSFSYSGQGQTREKDTLVTSFLFILSLSFSSLDNIPSFDSLFSSFARGHRRCCCRIKNREDNWRTMHLLRPRDPCTDCCSIFFFFSPSSMRSSRVYWLVNAIVRVSTDIDLFFLSMNCHVHMSLHVNVSFRNN